MTTLHHDDPPGTLAAMLFIPASDERKLDKIPSLPARAVLLDLEDGVAPNAKADARALLAGHPLVSRPEQRVWVRVNSAETAHLKADLEAAVRAGVHGINLPKVEGAAELHALDWFLTQLEGERTLPRLPVMATIETARGLENVLDIARATSRMHSLCFGSADYSRDLGLSWPPPEEPSPTLTLARARLVQASRAAGLHAPHDGASSEFRDLDRLRAQVQQAKALGFGGKHAIHPAQLPVIEAVFAPQDAELAWAEKTYAAFQEAVRSGQGAVNVGGQMVDAPIAERARQLLLAAGRTL
ncbi:CoA ester lyase (plasmid) [Deinococcus metallilatus]|uniref:Citrate lyase beta subunit n=1 Tax=Deinococcus metallilatus TaxID=1211322 RepID=A0AAJ5FC86_9DEIO|nr:CoA ester lyase [Deinococcus metallilatus]MBB5293463.1 citrate lyase beta subunit [Deinococcus metallilatus]QBY06548.1 CoA ester lyase [Deinococcus metallilatus]RXJ17891.1 CoA ester lyase [Deinococcus metallilatus]TLK32163.1 CoA ester lyase [Deinococcus metallilatus]GMA15317.1 (3S)-malyl-CoA thioesterase [Deinococcus metallilatus]